MLTQVWHVSMQKHNIQTFHHTWVWIFTEVGSFWDRYSKHLPQPIVLCYNIYF